jgi:hypothetical protein
MLISEGCPHRMQNPLLSELIVISSIEIGWNIQEWKNPYLPREEPTQNQP